MKKFLTLILLASCILFLGAKKKSTVFVKSPRIEKTINSNWTFNYFPGEEPGMGYEAAGYNDLNWPVISIPHTWMTYETTGDIHPFIKNISENDDPYWWKGWGWYRKHFTVNEKYKGQKVFIEFEGVQKYCEVWLNGKYLGDHKGGYGSFDFDLTGLIVPGKENVVTIAVNNRKDDQYKIPPMNVTGFNVYGGVYRDVNLVIKDKLYIPMQGSASHEGGTFITTPVISDKQAVVKIQTWVKNDYEQPKSCMLNTYIIDATNKIVQVIKSKYTINPGQLYKFEQTSKPVKNPHLWSPENPYMYKVYSEVTDGTKVTDSYTSPLGFRWLKWDYQEGALYVNGKKLAISGGKLGQEYPWLGAAIPEWLAEMDYKDIYGSKRCDLILTAGYPNDKQVYNLADKYGFVVIEESPSTGSQSFSAEVQEQQVKEMIRRDRNHPSIMFWSMGRETNHAADSKYARDEDTTRILTAYRVTDGSAGDYVRHEYDNLVLSDLNHYPLAGKEMKPVSGQQVQPGEPAKIVLNGSHKKINADRGSVTIVNAEITDSKGNRVYGATNTLKWEVTGPARLTGPSLFESDKNKFRSPEGARYTEIPVSNVIRSTGKSGKIRVTVSASGLASGTFEIDAQEIKPDNSAFTEPVLNDEGRRPVARAVLVIERLEEVPSELKTTTTDLNQGPSDRQGYKKAVREYIYRNNSAVDTATIEFRSLADLFASYMVNNNGILASSDFNFSISYYNNCRLISSYINATKLPPLFKEGLKKYYSDAIITNGSEKNAGDEMNWMNWIPSGGTVVISQDGSSTSWPKGTFVTDKDELPDLIAAVYPVFIKYSDEARERALTFVGKMNPYVHQESGDAGIIYRAEKGKPILIPLLKFISQ
ncbi:MAG: beta galactosidase jelly roll domain-containing protein [Bacteroidia bacterium]|nr:beta galactosidase jelly roll domain-containing protein [Bacteroidia bacterium]